MNFKMVQLNQLCSWVDERVALSSLDCDTYVSTENMLKNRGGICLASSVPEGGNAQAFKCGDILISNIRPYFKKIWMAKCSGGCSNDVLVLRSKPDVNALWLYYVLSSDDFFDYDTANSGGGKMPRGSKSAIMKYEVTVPDIEVQQKMAEVLRSYDVAIGNNRCRIALLEKMARELYRERFVRRKRRDSQVSIYTLATVQYGYAFDAKCFNTRNDGLPIARIRNIPDGWSNDYTSETAPGSYRITNGDLIVGMDGEFHINLWCGGDAYLVQRSCCFRPFDSKLRGYVMEAIRDPVKYFEGAAMGATVGHLGKKDIDTIQVYAPTPDEVEVFANMYDERLSLALQNRNLARQRDRLLPRLMSGKIDLDKLVKGEEVENG